MCPPSEGPYRAVGPYWVPLYAAPCKVESVTPRYFLPFRWFPKPCVEVRVLPGAPGYLANNVIEVR